MRVRDLTGQRFGRLMVADRPPHRQPVRWECVCDCGAEKLVKSDHLVSGYVQSCGCLALEYQASKGNDLTGIKFGRLTAVSLVDAGSENRRRWRCVCECGSRKTVAQCKLSSGETRSCGCLRREVSAARLRSVDRNDPKWQSHSLTFGLVRRGKKRHPLYASWRAMINRCSNKKVEDFPRYGGRGISVCDRWQGRDGFFNFISDMGDRPNGMSIDRIDVNGNYEPANCRWATQQQQARNQARTVVSVEMKLDIEGRISRGERQSHIARDLGIKPHNVSPIARRMATEKFEPGITSMAMCW